MRSESMLAPRRLAIALAAVCAFLELYVTQAMLPALREVFHASVTGVSLTVTASTLAVALSAPVAGALSQRFGRRRVLVGSAFGLGLATLASASAGSLELLIIWRFVQGLFIPGLFTAAVAYIAEEWDPGETAAVTALFTSGSVLGSFVGRYLGGLVTQIRSWEAAFFVLGVLTLALAVVLWRGLPQSRRFRPSAGVGAALRGLPAGLRNRRLLATCAVGFGTLFGQVATFTYISFHLAAPPYHLNTRELGEVVAVFLVGMLINPLLGRLAQRYGELRLLQFGLLLGLTGILLTLATPLPVILLGLGMLAASTFVSQSMSISVVPKLAPALRSAAVGLYVSAYYLGGTAGALLPGLLWSRLGWSGTVALVALAQVAVALIAAQTWRDLAPSPRDPDLQPPEERTAGA